MEEQNSEKDPEAKFLDVDYTPIVVSDNRNNKSWDVFERLHTLDSMEAWVKEHKKKSIKHDLILLFLTVSAVAFWITLFL